MQDSYKEETPRHWLWCGVMRRMSRDSSVIEGQDELLQLVAYLCQVARVEVPDCAEADVQLLDVASGDDESFGLLHPIDS